MTSTCGGSPATHTIKVRTTGVEKVLGLAFRGGKLYALEMSTTAGGPTPGTGAISWGLACCLGR